MDETYKRDLRHIPRSLRRRIIGWVLLAIGVAMLVLPGPGLLFIALAAIVLGRRDPILRRPNLIVRLSLRRLSRAEQRLVRWAAIWLREHHRGARLFVREQLHFHAQGRPLNPWIRIWIGMTLAIALASLGAGIYALLA